MRNLNPNERRLLAIFLVAGLLIGNLVLLRSLSSFLATKRAEIQTLRAQLAESEHWINEGPFWLARNEWIESNPPALYQPGQTDVSFLTQTQDDLRKFGIETVDDPVLATEPIGSFVEVRITFRRLVGTLEEIIRWMVEFQQPGNYTTMRTFTLNSDNDPTKVVLDVTLSRFFANNSPAQPSK